VNVHSPDESDVPKAMKPVEIEYDPQRLVFEAIQAGDTHAMAEFIETQRRWVRAVVFGVLGRASEVDDVCQRVWIQVWRESRSLDDPGRWRPWLYRIAHNAATDALRAGRRRRNLLAATATELMVDHGPIGPTAASPDRELVSREQHDAMRQAIESLPPLYREPFVLKLAEGWSYARIGQALGLPTDTVETRLVRARRLLREKLAGGL
jgi:RNA polymerase sigma-70 factor, ECF subfamily